MPTTRGTARRAGARAQGADIPPVDPNQMTVFGDGGDNVVRGEVLVVLAPDAAAGIATSVPTGPSRGLFEGISTTFGLDTLDRTMRDMGVRSITRLHAPGPPRPFGGVLLADPDELASTYRVRFDPATPVDQAVQRLVAAGEVVTAEPNRWREAYAIPNDPDFAQQWGLTKINAPDAWDRTTGDPSIVVGIVDTGIDLDHPELQPLIVAGQDLVDLGTSPTAPAGWVFEGDFVGVDADPQDEVGHGTHVAGTVSALSNNGVGVAGVTWQCRLMPVRVLARIRRLSDNRVSGVGSAADIAAGIRWAVDHGARVINMSLGGDVDTTVERNAVAYAIQQGVVVVAAMGNDNTSTPSFPGAYPDVIAVGATNPNDTRASFSNMGPHIDVAAPGVGIRSTYWDNTYANLQGTSMASPHVAGVAALILSCNPNLPAAQVGQIIRDTARPLRDNPADPVPNNNYGYGMVDAKAAVDRACPPPPSRPILTCPSFAISCPSIRQACPSVVTVCASQQVCPSQQIACQSIRCPSVITVCPSVGICPSVTVCPSQTVVCQSIRCPSVQIVCQSLRACPSQGIACQSIQACPSLAGCPTLAGCPSQAICPSQQACPSLGGCPTIQCGGGPGPIGPGGGGFGFGFGGGQEGEGAYDPYGYDPYGNWYGEGF